MINSLVIKNFAIIEDLEVNFLPGYSVITGETGAGKSIIIDALSLLLGERSSFNQIRNGTNRAFIEGSFYIDNDDTLLAINTIMEDLVSLDDHLLVVTRTLDNSGRSILKMNGRSVTLAISKSVMSYLIDIHSQHENMLLLDEHRHLALLDEFIKDNPVYHEYRESYKRYLDLLAEQKSILQATISDDEIDFLKSQIDEIEKVNPLENEEEELEAKVSLLRNLEKIAGIRNGLYDLLSGDRGAVTNLYLATKEINNLGDDFAPFAERINEYYYGVRDQADSIIDKLDALLESNDNIEEIDNRLYRIRKLIRKYGTSAVDVLAAKKDMEQKLSNAQNFEVQKSRISKAITNELNTLNLKANALTEKRKNKAIDLCREINLELKDLALDNAEFKVAFSLKELSPNGHDDVAFVLAANKGSAFLPIKNAISGGEASRLMLALKIIFRRLGSAETLIFDEVDTGISGRIASMVGKKIANLAKDTQVIAITHLAQVASFADHHYYVSKLISKTSTHAEVSLLDEEDTVEAIAKMLGGDVITATVISAARELRSEAKKLRQDN
ncbi:MAG: DNA repair protein RecN [Bacilli bacterium]|jgi:DNA repair protein RecN (Recombination protein N)|nr:DNA repair protein RecN [Bacilli bacterium]MCH4235316.1 DNA repair protein RecN [Bacilli bacterium]